MRRLTLGDVGWPHGEAEQQRGGWSGLKRRVRTLFPTFRGRRKRSEPSSESDGHSTGEPSTVGLARANDTDTEVSKSGSAPQSADIRGAPSSGSNGSDTVRDNGFVPERNAGGLNESPVSRETRPLDEEATSTLDMGRFMGRAAAPSRVATAEADHLPAPIQRTGTIYGRGGTPIDLPAPPVTVSSGLLNGDGSPVAAEAAGSPETPEPRSV